MASARSPCGLDAACGPDPMPGAGSVGPIQQCRGGSLALIQLPSGKVAWPSPNPDIRGERPWPSTDSAACGESGAEWPHLVVWGKVVWEFGSQGGRTTAPPLPNFPICVQPYGPDLTAL